jgi:hypothetical protein
VKQTTLKLDPGQRFVVYSYRGGPTGGVYVAAGKAWANDTGGIDVYLDVLPLDGKLKVDL